MSAPRYNATWSRDELILALYLYCQTPFAKTKANNPEVIALAHFLGRTPSSVARKLGNFGAFDPLLASRGISGLTHYSKADKAVWEEFTDNWEVLVSESQALLKGESVVSVETEFAIDAEISRGTERLVITTARVGQSFFRRSVLSSYGYTCCICALDVKELLVGSHIVPWSVAKDQRLNPHNGLSLCSLHDKAFDIGLISIATDLTVLVSNRLRHSRSKFARLSLLEIEQQAIKLPQRFAPSREFLAWHNEFKFQG